MNSKSKEKNDPVEEFFLELLKITPEELKKAREEFIKDFNKDAGTTGKSNKSR